MVTVSLARGDGVTVSGASEINVPTAMTGYLRYGSIVYVVSFKLLLLFSARKQSNRKSRRHAVVK